MAGRLGEKKKDFSNATIRHRRSSGLEMSHYGDISRNNE
jgi:hypothetical protein